MLRAALAGLSLLTLAAACDTMPDGKGGGVNPAHATHAAIPVVDKYATSADGTKIHYLASGKGPLVVMIHGYPDFSGSWDLLTPKLNDAYRTVAMDTRGYNLSGQPVGVANYAMPKLVEDIQAVIKAEGYSKATVLGHDWGAAQAWNFAFAHPEMLERLVILSVPHPANMGRQLKAAPQNSNYARNFQKEGSENSLTAEGLAGWVKDPAEKQKYIEAFKRSSFAGMMNYYRANYPAAPDPNAPAPTYPKINVPVLVIHGMKDQALLSMGHDDTWDQIAKDTTLLMVPDANHFVQHDAPELVNGTIRAWLDLHPVK
ncbi:MAG TPA: alpha/beta hydrolase [Hyphomonadaceae bacterium]|nr:alpha/beta hydrolase [Hyphomonadaceae bacterium]